MPEDEFEILDEEGSEAYLAKLREKLKVCRTEREEYLNGWQRAKADLMNYRKDEAIRLQDGLRKAENRIIQAILPALDSFDRALSDVHKKHLSDGAERGFTLIRAQFAEILKQIGVEETETIGKLFDPSLHEAVAEVESDQPGGTIVDVLEKGYCRGGETIRPAKVTIALYRS